MPDTTITAATSSADAQAPAIARSVPESTKRHQTTMLHNRFFKAVNDGDVATVTEMATRDGIAPSMRYGAALTEAIALKNGAMVDCLARLGMPLELKHLQMVIDQERSDLGESLIDAHQRLLREASDDGKISC